MNMITCWCGNTNLLTFSSDYSKCSSCGTLVCLNGLAPEKLKVLDDETDFYGKQYWLEHQQDAFGYPEIHTRARNDLTERNLHWLKTLLKYCLPPAKVLELGCSHGSFVALMGQAGYDASGVEMSPWVVEFGKKTFGVPVLVGPIEDLDIAPGSFDVIVLMDVLEHLPDPVATMAHCLKALKPDGLILLQTPKFKEAINYSVLIETKDRFQEMLIPEEHIYLFSENSVTRLFQQLGAEYIQFEPAIFGHYDMFFVVSRVPLKVNTPKQIDSVLLSNPKGRFALALLDVYLNKIDYAAKLVEQIDTLTGWVHEALAEGDSLRENYFKAMQQIDTLTGWVHEARAEGDLLRENYSKAVQQIDTLTGWVHEARAEGDLLRENHSKAVQQIDTLTGWVHEARAEGDLLRENYSKAMQQIELFNNLHSQSLIKYAKKILNFQEHISTKLHRRTK